MKKTVKRIIASFLVAIMVLGSAPIDALTGIDFGSLFGINAEAANGINIDAAPLNGMLNTYYSIQEDWRDEDVGSVQLVWPILLENNVDTKNFNKALFNQVNSPLYYRSQYKKVHSGIDIYANVGTVVSSVADGVVHKKGTWGDGSIYICIRHDNLYSYNGKSTVYSVFCHLKGHYPGIKVGDKVKAGQPIAYSGNSGGVAAHLHFSMYRDINNDCTGKTYININVNGGTKNGVKYEKGVFSYVYRLADLDPDLAEMYSNNQLTKATAKTTKRPNSEKAWLCSKPYDNEAYKITEVDSGKDVTILGWVKNNYKNIWWRVNYNGQEGWMYKDWTTAPNEGDPSANIDYFVKYSSANNYKQRLDTLDKYQKYNKESDTSSNDGISVRGTIDSPGRNIKKLTASILKITDSKGSTTTVCTAYVDPNRTSYTLGSDKLDGAMTFKSLKPGTYKYVITAELEPSKLPGAEKKENTVVLEECTFSVYSEKTSQATKESYKKEVEKLIAKFVVGLINGIKDYVLVEKEKPIVNPPAPKPEPDSGNTGSGGTTTPTPTPTPTPAPTPAVKVYYPGHYRTTSSDNLNVRTGPGSSYAKATAAIPKGTEIGITEVSSNGWGKTVYRGVTGWVALNYCTYLGAFAEIQKPGTVTVNYNSDKDIAAGSVINVSWNAINYADAYNAYLKKSDGTVVKTQTDIKGTSTYFTVDDAGIYYVTVAATNSQHVGDESAPTATFTSHAPCTVTFLDWNGRTEVRTVKYGEAATPPVNPTREGYIFKGWKQSFDHVTTDITVEADYQIIEYSVKFVSEVKNPETGKTEQIVLKNEKVKYGGAATPPSEVDPPSEFYVFAGWNTEDYKCVKSSLTVKSVFQWKNATLPVGISNVKTTRVSGGYAVVLDVSCTEASYQTGRIIVSLKTAEGKQVVTTESAAFSLPSNTQVRTMDELFVPTDEPATVAEIYVVESFGKAIPISAVVKSTINMNDEWSGWTEDVWPDNTYDEVDTRTLYRYKTYSTTTANTKTLPGWSYMYSTSTTSNKVIGYNYVAPINTDAQKRDVKTYNEDIYSTWYSYHHYTNGGYNAYTGKTATWACSPYYGNNDDKCGPTNIGPHYYYSASRLPAQTSTTWKINKYSADCKTWVSNSVNNRECINTWFFSETPYQQVTGSRTRYEYTDTYYTHYFEKWSDWSSWTTTSHTQSETKTVETKPQYRYKMNGLGIENNEGVARIASTISAGLTENDILMPNLKEFAGKAVVLYIYKYGEASDWTGEYIGQQTIDADGNYSFNFKLREEPTAVTGDYLVSIGIEGCSDTMTIGKIVAPKPEYKVVFKYSADPADSESEEIVLDEQIIKEGEAAVAPEHVVFEGYKFLGWNTDLSYITEDTMFVEYGNETEEKIITFKANYEPEEYVVVFVDWDNDSLVMKRYKYGENIVAPIIKTAEGHQALWEGLDMENPVVTGDTVITAKHTKKTYEVNFYNYEGEIIDTQTVEYGSTASDVNLEDKENFIFVDWEYNEDLFENSIVEGDIIYAGEPVVNFYPVYVFDESVENPTSSLENGTYAEEQTVKLTTATEGAVIYYTLDGTDPKTAVNDIDQVEKVFEYTGPITINRSVTLKYYACAFEKNDSEVMTNYYAVNAGQTESEWMLYEDLPEYVTENEGEYEIESAQGYRYRDVAISSNYSDIADLEAQGWENTGFEYGEWSDWLMEEPDLAGTAYESETMEPEPELEVRYQYSRYKYLDSTGAYVYSPTEVSGFECEYETLLLETKLATAGYLSGTTTKYYNYNGEKWFNYGLTEVEVVPDYMMFRYRLKEYTLKKWGAWTTEAPAEGETRENESGTVYKYLVPEMCVVKIVPDYSDFGVETQYYIIEVNEYLTIDEADYTYEGYDFLGFYTDSEFTKYFNHKTTPITEELTLYPKYKAHEFAVIFVDYDGTVMLEETVEYGQCASAFEFEEIEREGYVFIGWDYEGLDFVTEDIIATAQYVKEEEYCTVSLNYGKYNMMSGNSFQLVATITPEDTENSNLIWYSTDETVATVSDDGFVTAVGEGTASIIVETESTGMIDECVINVVSNPSESLCLAYSSTLTLDKENALLRGVTNSVWTVSAIKQEFMNEAEDMQIVDINGNELADDAFVGTGSVIRFMNGETVLDEVNIVVTGDMNGDGYVNNRDAAMITRYLVEKETADFCQMVAIDVNGDGFVNNRDASMVSRYLVGKETL